MKRLHQHDVAFFYTLLTEKKVIKLGKTKLVHIFDGSKTNKDSAVQRLKKYLEKEWFKTLKEVLVTNRDFEIGNYRGYWCIESAVLVKVLGLDDTELRDCKYYPYDMAHFSE